MILWRLQGLTEDDEDGFCGHLGVKGQERI